MIKNVPHPSRGPSTTVSLRSDFSMEASQQLTFMSYPLRICSGLCCAGSLLVQFTSLSTSYWVLESTQKGLVHSGLWKICINTKCTMYQFNLLGKIFHATVVPCCYTYLEEFEPHFSSEVWYMDINTGLDGNVGLWFAILHAIHSLRGWERLFWFGVVVSCTSQSFPPAF